MEVCSYCYGAVFTEYDPDDTHRLVRKCINCGRSPKEERDVTREADIPVRQDAPRWRNRPEGEATADPLATYAEAARRAIALHDAWQAKDKEAAELRKQASEAWALSVKARQALDEYLERLNGQQPPEAKPETAKRHGPKQSPETIAKRMATIAARRAALADAG